jgi:hypothetical protein
MPKSRLSFFALFSALTILVVACEPPRNQQRTRLNPGTRSKTEAGNGGAINNVGPSSALESQKIVDTMAQKLAGTRLADLGQFPPGKYTLTQFATTLTLPSTQVLGQDFAVKKDDKGHFTIDAIRSVHSIPAKGPKTFAVSKQVNYPAAVEFTVNNDHSVNVTMAANYSSTLSSRPTKITWKEVDASSVPTALKDIENKKFVNGAIVDGQRTTIFIQRDSGLTINDEKSLPAGDKQIVILIYDRTGDADAIAPAKTEPEQKQETKVDTKVDTKGETKPPAAPDKPELKTPAADQKPAVETKTPPADENKTPAPATKTPEAETKTAPPDAEKDPDNAPKAGEPGPHTQFPLEPADSELSAAPATTIEELFPHTEFPLEPADGVAPVKDGARPAGKTLISL